MQTNCCFAIVNGDYLKLQKITIRRHQLRITCLLIAVFMHLQVAPVSVPVSGHVVSCQRRLVRTTGGAGESITLWLNRASYIHCVSNNAQTLRSCRFDKHRPVLIILCKRHQPLSKMTCAFNFPYLFSFTYIIKFALNTCHGNDAKHRFSRWTVGDSEKSRFCSVFALKRVGF